MTSKPNKATNASNSSQTDKYSGLSISPFLIIDHSSTPASVGLTSSSNFHSKQSIIIRFEVVSYDEHHNLPFQFSTKAFTYNLHTCMN